MSTASFKEFAKPPIHIAGVIQPRSVKFDEEGVQVFTIKIPALGLPIRCSAAAAGLTVENSKKPLAMLAKDSDRVELAGHYVDGVFYTLTVEPKAADAAPKAAAPVATSIPTA